jgi:hypothetical protein
LALLEKSIGQQSRIISKECCQSIGCEKIHAQGLAAHGQTPWTWKQAKKLIDGIKNIIVLETKYNENSKHN